MILRYRNSILLFLLLIISVFIFTFPLVLRPNSYIPGFESTDETYGALWNFWWLKFVSQRHLTDKSCSLIAAPFGIASSESGYPIWNFINKRLTLATSPVFAYNFEVIFSFLASAICMYYLMLYLSGSKICAIFSAAIYNFCPYHFARAWQHLGLAQIQWMPLYILALLKLKDKPDLKHALFAAVSLFLVFSFDLYYAYFMLIVSGLFIIFMLITDWKKKTKNTAYFKSDFKIIWRLFISLFLVFMMILPTVIQVVKNRENYSGKESSAYNPYIRPFEDLFAQSARPLSYFLPATAHPVLGKFTEDFIGSDLYGESLTEHALYLGWVPFILAIIAFRRRAKSRKKFYVSFFAFLALGAWLFSQPPWWNILGFKLYMPPFFMYKALSMFRAYCRFGIVVMLAVSVLSGFGLMFLLERFKDKNRKIVIGILFFAVVFFEFWNYPPLKVIDVSKVPDVYYWLKGQPQDFTIAEYPLDAVSPNEMYKFYQATHEKRIINGTIPGTLANRVAGEIVKLSEARTAGILKWMAVKYVLVHKENYLKTDLVEEEKELNMIPMNQGIKLIKSFPAQACLRQDVMCAKQSGPVDVYEVVASFSIEPVAKN